MLIDEIKSVYFIGIGGIGMSALARYFKFLGKNVAGYDRMPTQLTGELEAAGIIVGYEDCIDFITEEYRDKASTLVVVTPAVPQTHRQWQYFEKNSFAIKKRAEVLGIITKGTYCFAVAGTHGKTTTTSILGHLLFEAGVDVTAFVGGVVENYQTNLIGSGTTVTVVEADEFDRSFLKLSPDVACVTSTEADHLDIFGTAEEMYKSFEEFTEKLSDRSKLFVADGVSLKGIQVGFSNTSPYHIKALRLEEEAYVFTIVTPKEEIQDVRFYLPGHHNLSNALVAFAMAYDYGVSKELLVKALASFRGVRRRFSYKIKEQGLVYVDDYAHHPTEIKAASQAIHEIYGKKKIVAVFQPHLFSRTNDFMEEFASALSTFDDLILLDIYPAREEPIEGVNSTVLLEKVTSPNKVLVRKEDLAVHMKARNAEVYITLGAGDIGELVEEIRLTLLK